MKINTAPQTLPLSGKAVAAKIKDMKLPLDIEESYVSAVQERPSVSLGEMRALVEKMADGQADSDTAAAYELNLNGVFPKAPEPSVDVKALVGNVSEKMGDDPWNVGGAFIAGMRELKTDSVSHSQIGQVMGQVKEKMDGPYLHADHAEGAAWETESLELALGKFLKAQLGGAAAH
jgi:hypothetical protein